MAATKKAPAKKTRAKPAAAKAPESPPSTDGGSAAMLDAVTHMTARSPADLIDYEEVLREEVSASWRFRGQPGPYGTLVPSLQRVFAERKSVATATLVEQTLLNDFVTHYQALDVGPNMPQPYQLLEMREASERDDAYFSVMQHYGVPTRLLDWTTDFWIAVYFACTGNPDEDGELWIYDRAIFDSDPMSWNGNILLREFDERLTPRMEQQSGQHTVSSEILADHAPLLHDLSSQHEFDQGLVEARRFRRVAIAQASKEKVIRFLGDQMNVTASTVFPDLEGLGRFLRWQLDTLVARLL